MIRDHTDAQRRGDVTRAKCLRKIKQTIEAGLLLSAIERLCLRLRRDTPQVKNLLRQSLRVCQLVY